MANLRYLKGANKERSAVKRLKREGYDLAQRSRGSKSPVDVWGLIIKDKIIKLIQVKAGTFTDSQANKIMLDNSHLNGTYKVDFEIWCEHEANSLNRDFKIIGLNDELKLKSE